MAKFLYGFSVQGISEYIFSSNALREIIGASEIVKKIDALGAKGDDAKGAKLVQIFELENEPEIILAAAGNLRAVFENEADLKKIVRELPRRVFEFAGEINIAQAVVKFDGDYKKATQELESRLKIQRNKAQFPQIYGFNFLKKYPKTAKPIFISGVDKTTHLKLKECTEFDKTHGDSISNLPEISNYKNKIAIIYADGNGLGQIVKDLDDKQMREFSQKLDHATKAAFKSAKDAVLEDLKLDSSGKNPALTKQGKLKIREVICGGDDLAVICSADIALKLAQNFMR